jgi:hypothetical protein
MDIELLRSAYKRQFGLVDKFFHKRLGKNPYTRKFLENHKAILLANLFDELIKIQTRVKYDNYPLEKLISKKAKKVYIDYIRSLQRESIRKAKVATDEPPENHGIESFHNEIEAKDATALIRKFLSPEDYNLLYYHGAAGYTFNQVLQITNYPSANAARTRYYRIKKLVRQHFGVHIYKN